MLLQQRGRRKVADAEVRVSLFGSVSLQGIPGDQGAAGPAGAKVGDPLSPSN